MVVKLCKTVDDCVRVISSQFKNVTVSEDADTPIHFRWRDEDYELIVKMNIFNSVVEDEVDENQYIRYPCVRANFIIEAPATEQSVRRQAVLIPCSEDGASETDVLMKIAFLLGNVTAEFSNQLYLEYEFGL